ncbi:MAG: hypothetical protein ACERK6_03480 [Candidatus Aminicenantaceae bacterium]
MNPEHFPTSGDAEDQNPIPEFFVTLQNECLIDLLFERLEKRLLVRILSMNRGDRQRTAEYLEMEYAALCQELKKHHLIILKDHQDT